MPPCDEAVMSFLASGRRPIRSPHAPRREPSSSRAAVQLLCQADAGPFAEARAEALRLSRDARRHAARNRVIRESAAGGVPLCPQACGASATAYTKHVRRTNLNSRGGTLSMKLRSPHAQPLPVSVGRVARDSARPTTFGPRKKRFMVEPASIACAAVRRGRTSRALALHPTSRRIAGCGASSF